MSGQTERASFDTLLSRLWVPGRHGRELFILNGSLLVRPRFMALRQGRGRLLLLEVDRFRLLMLLYLNTVCAAPLLRLRLVLMCRDNQR